MFPGIISWQKLILPLWRNSPYDTTDSTWQKLEVDGKHGIFLAINMSVLHNEGKGEDVNLHPNSL